MLKILVQVTADPWCSGGGLAPDGTLISTGGFLDGAKTIRYVGGPACKGNNCDWREHNNALQEARWYVQPLKCYSYHMFKRSKFLTENKFLRNFPKNIIG